MKKKTAEWYRTREPKKPCQVVLVAQLRSRSHALPESRLRLPLHRSTVPSSVLCMNMPPAAAKYICPCSKCLGVSRSLTKRTIETHLQQDCQFLQTLSSDGESAILVQSCISQTRELLSWLHQGPILPGTVPDTDGSHSDGPEGALISTLTDT